MSPEGVPLPPQETKKEDSVNVAEIVASDFRAVLEAIKLLGPGNPENRELVIQWTTRREEAVRQHTGREELARASILFNIDRAELYFAAGNIDGAVDSLYDAIDQAANEGHEDLQQQAQMKADSVTAHNRWA